MNFNANDKIVILLFGGDEYIQELNNSLGPFTMFPGGNGCSPTVTGWECQQACSCSVDNTFYIRDLNGNKIPRLVGTRPPNLLKRF